MITEELIKKSQEKFGERDFDLSSDHEALFQSVKSKILEQIDFTGLDFEERVEKVRTSTWRIIEEQLVEAYNHLILTPYEKSEILEKILEVMFGFGVIEKYINDERVTEIMINGTDYIFYEQDGKLDLLKDSQGRLVNYRSETEIMHVIDKIVAPINRKVDQSNPIVDARLPNGSRVNIVIPPASLDGPVVTIRKFPENPYSMKDLIGFGALTEEVAGVLRTLVRSRYNIIVAGGTGSGKTTFLNALSQYIPGDQRIITVEDSAELKISQIKNLVRMETRPPNIEGKGEITIRDLVKTALRMRPDRIVVGEVRGAEALDMLQAMNTGHDGSLTTGHSNSSSDMLSRLETMVMMAGMELPILSVRQQIASAVDIIIFLRKLHTGQRVVDEIVEIAGISKDTIHVNPLAKLRFDHNEVGIEFTGNKLINKDKLIYSGEMKGESNELIKKVI